MLDDTPTAVKVFVTTQAAIDTCGYGRGKWFELQNYSNKTEFFGAAKEYVAIELPPSDGKILLHDAEASFDSLFNLNIDKLIKDNDVSDALWQLLAMTEEDLDILNAFLSVADMINNSYKETLDRAKLIFLGCFLSDASYAEHRYKDELEAMPEQLRASIDLDKLGAELSKEVLSSNGFYFNDNPYR